MAYFARLEGDRVVAVHVVSDEIEDGAAFLADLHGGETWVETFTDGQRGQQASINDVYDIHSDIFITPQPPNTEES
jgi:hypothetical protein